MKIQATLCALAALASVASATLVIAGTTTLALGGGTVAVLLGAKLLALKGLLIGRALGKRSTENLAEIFLEASRKDQYDCAKLLVCELNAKPAQEMMEDEMIIGSAFGQMEAIDVTAPSVEFDLASLVGRMVGSQRCKTLYSRCAVTPNAIMEGIRKVAFAKKN
jgi:hypothetical protein